MHIEQLVSVATEALKTMQAIALELNLIRKRLDKMDITMSRLNEMPTDVKVILPEGE